jgi:DNA-binding NarL/FixJ family response regulator
MAFGGTWLDDILTIRTIKMLQYSNFHPIVRSDIVLKPDTAQISVLIIEDHQVTLDGLVASLWLESGIAVIGSAVNLNQGLSLAAQLHPDIILLELHLPDSSGPKTTITRLSEVSNASIIVFSVENRIPFVSAALRAGAKGYLIKSESVHKVANAIRTVVNENKIVLSSELTVSCMNITRSEEEVLKMLARGMKYDQIAQQRNSSPSTVRKQCELLLLKLNLEHREQLIAWAVFHGYRDLEFDPYNTHTRIRVHANEVAGVQSL